ncbi:energy transducer TonB family protein [Roseococcus sp. YIM B11640]|uniref:energy transducer TonB family protein n=1 Tax=Roseococcus sp. YIM B11640 TaxID=3133973 RepID=UPI003C7AF8FC
MSASAASGRLLDPDSPQPRYGVALALVLALHAGAVAVALMPRQNTQPVAAEAILIDLTPDPAPPAEEPPAVEPEALPEAAPPPEPVAEEPPPPEPPPPEAPAEVALPEPPPPPPPPEPPPPRRVTPPRPPRPQPVQRTVPAEAPPAEAPAAAPAVAPGPAAPARASGAAVTSWQGQIMARLQAYRRYPDSSRFRREEGVVYLAFTMDRGGNVLSARIARSSGHSALDEETVELARRASPLPAPPADVQGNPLSLTVPVRFSLR